MSSQANVSNAGGLGPLRIDTEAPSERNGDRQREALLERIAKLELELITLATVRKHESGQLASAVAAMSQTKKTMDTQLTIAQDQVADLQYRIDNFRDRYIELEAEKDTAEASLKEVSKELDDARYEHRNEIATLEMDLCHEREKMAAAEKKCKELEAKLKQQNGVVNHLEKECVILEEEKRLMHSDMQTIISKSTEPYLREQNAVLQTKMKEAEAEIHDLRAIRTAFENAEGEIRRLQKQYKEALATIEDKQLVIAANQRAIEASQHTKEAVDEVISKHAELLSHAIEQAKAQKAAGDAALWKTQRRNETLTAKNSALETVNRSIDTDVRNLLEIEQNLYKEIDGLRAEMDGLRAEKEKLISDQQKHAEQKEEWERRKDELTDQKSQLEENVSSLQADIITMLQRMKTVEEESRKKEGEHILQTVTHAIEECRLKEEKSVEALLKQITMLNSDKQQMKEWCEKSQAQFQSTLQHVQQQNQLLEVALFASEKNFRDQQEIHRMVFDRIMLGLKENEPAQKSLIAMVEQLPVLFHRYQETGRLPVDELPSFEAEQESFETVAEADCQEEDVSGDDDDDDEVSVNPDTVEIDEDVKDLLEISFISECGDC